MPYSVSRNAILTSFDSDYKHYAVAAYSYEVFYNRGRLLSQSQFDECASYHYQQASEVYDHYLLDKPVEKSFEAIFKRTKRSKWHKLIQDRDFAVYLRETPTLPFDGSAFEIIDLTNGLYRTTCEYYGLAAGQNVVITQVKFQHEASSEDEIYFADMVDSIYWKTKEENYLGYFYDDHLLRLTFIHLPDNRQIIP